MHALYYVYGVLSLQLVGSCTHSTESCIAEGGREAASNVSKEISKEQRGFDRQSPPDIILVSQSLLPRNEDFISRSGVGVSKKGRKYTATATAIDMLVWL